MDKAERAYQKWVDDKPNSRYGTLNREGFIAGYRQCETDHALTVQVHIDTNIGEVLSQVQTLKDALSRLYD